MAENKIALHEQSILKIGESVSKNFTDIAKSLPMQLSLPGMAGVPALAGAEGLNAADQTFEERSLSLLESIEISIVAMMNTMVDLLAVEEDQLDLKKPTPSFTKEQSREDDKEKPKGPGIIERGIPILISQATFKQPKAQSKYQSGKGGGNAVPAVGSAAP